MDKLELGSILYFQYKDANAKVNFHLICVLDFQKASFSGVDLQRLYLFDPEFASYFYTSILKFIGKPINFNDENFLYSLVMAYPKFGIDKSARDVMKIQKDNIVLYTKLMGYEKIVKGALQLSLRRFNVMQCLSNISIIDPKKLDKNYGVK